MGMAASNPPGRGVPEERAMEVNIPRPALGIVEGARYIVHLGVLLLFMFVFVSVGDALL